MGLPGIMIVKTWRVHDTKRAWHEPDQQPSDLAWSTVGVNAWVIALGYHEPTGC